MTQWDWDYGMTEDELDEFIAWLQEHWADEIAAARRTALSAAPAALVDQGAPDPPVAGDDVSPATAPGP
jgi:hypothetical protein